MKYLVDANVLSEPTKPSPNSRVVAWLQRLHCLPFEATTGLRWAELLAKLRANGRAMRVKDSLIAATALANGFVVATRNGVDFEKAGVDIIDPFTA